MKRQVNNCALAQQVWGALRPKAAAPASDTIDSGIKAQDSVAVAAPLRP